jgi:Protein of unknown function (DUF4199)
MAFLDNPNDFQDEKNVGFSQVVIKYGLISAAVSIISSLVMSLTKLSTASLGAQIPVFAVLLAVSIYILILEVREHRDKDLGGFISFGRVFLIILIALVISGIIGGIFQYVYFNYINPHAMEEVLEAQREMVEKIANWARLPEDQIEAQMDAAKATMQSPAFILQTAVGSIFGGSIIAVIMAAILKKPRTTY